MTQPMGMSVNEAAAELGVATATLYSLANEGKLPGARRIGKRIIIHREVFTKWLSEGVGE
jgi:excisionase family DNA binding protein